ncbi:Deoxyribodipyrimidine photo-lyase [Gorgonomyces haynaldii]|nr:Deoxyribodipyrimidine photo-lyase [Gorgonomyces haynaldii]
MHIFIFRRDFRLSDNTALIALAKKVKPGTILPIFIFNPKQITDLNPYYGPKCVRFLLESLKSVEDEIKACGGKLHYYESQDDTDVLKSLPNVESVWFNRDVTPFSKQRDQKIEQWCRSNGIECNSLEDYTLHPVDLVRNGTGGIYQVYTPFFNACQRYPVRKTQKVNLDGFFAPPTESMDSSEIDKYAPPRGKDVMEGGRHLALEILDRISRGIFKKYSTERDDMAAAKTTLLSSYLKYGCVSMREAYEAMVQGNGPVDHLVKELYWREFYLYLTHFKPELLQKQVDPEKQNLALKSRMNAANRFIIGKTGFPIVDAGMRQLLETGNMHNRARMIVAMFLTKNLHIDWRAGEQFFAQHLIDYDPSQNSGGWQWSASTGVDTQPYRIFNPWTQTERYDSECKYIKRWVPELKGVPAGDILKWEKEQIRSNYVKRGIYMHPIVDHPTTSRLGKEMLKGEITSW